MDYRLTYGVVVASFSPLTDQNRHSRLNLGTFAIDPLETISLPSQAVVLSNQSGSRTDFIIIAHPHLRSGLVSLTIDQIRDCGRRMRETLAQQ